VDNPQAFRCPAGPPPSARGHAPNDRSDLDAFREATIRIAVNSAEAPRQLIQAADAVVSGPREVVAMLEHLADD